MDDITVIVVDVNPKEQEFINGKVGTQTRDVHINEDTGETMEEMNACAPGCSVV